MANLRFSVILIALAAITIQAGSFQDHHIAILERQAPGTPQYDCHSNCGNAAAGGRLEGHCTNTTWTGYYEACLECALEFDIWKHYSTGVTAGASACGLTPTPSPALAASTSGSVIPTGSPTRTGVAPSTTAPPSTTPAGSPAATSTSTAGALGIGMQGTGSLRGSGPVLAAMLGFIAALV